MKKTGNTTLFMLGIAGMGLSIAMFFDAKKSPTGLPCKHKQVKTDEESIEKKEEEEPTLFTPLSPVPEEQQEEEEEEETKVHMTPVTPTKPNTYKDMYKEYQQKKIGEYIKNAPDHSYTGDGSKWSKRMYFIKEAYRRSREATPVDPLIKQRVKYSRDEIKKNTATKT